MSVTVAIVYHSGYGHTERMMRAVADGAEGAGAAVHILKAAELEHDTDDWAKLDQADAIVFGSPTYMGSVSGPMEVFFDKTSKPWMTGAWKNKIAAGFTNSGSPSGDKVVTMIRMVTVAAQLGMIWVGFDQPKADDGSMNRLGGYLGALAQSDNAPPEEGNPPEADLNTARAHGERIAQATMRWQRGGIGG
ncbi:MAG: flavodoxin family protein [Pseudomonadota bacterium]